MYNVSPRKREKRERRRKIVEEILNQNFMKSMIYTLKNFNKLQVGETQRDSQCCSYSVSQSRSTLSEPMDYCTPGLPIPHHLWKFAQVHVCCIRDAIQLSCPLKPSSPALKLSQHQGLFQSVSCLHQVTKILRPTVRHIGIKQIKRQRQRLLSAQREKWLITYNCTSIR